MSALKHGKPPSSGTAGFFQTPPALVSSFEDDATLQRVFQFYLPSSTQQKVAPDLDRFSKLVLSPQIRAWGADAERNTPYVKQYNDFGNRVDELVTSAGWQELQKLGITEGIVALGHDATYGRHARVHQFIKYHIWTPWNAGVTCPSAMTDGAARLLALQLQKSDLGHQERAVFEEAYRRLISTDTSIAWTSGQWMTERPGGSDVRNTETQASIAIETGGEDHVGQPLGPVSISGFKWFSSATDADSTVLLATEPSGAISAFFAPTKRRSIHTIAEHQPKEKLNGIHIQRLKSKLGTRALPTAELVLDNMRAYRFGKPGQGTKEISTVLNITRLHNAVTAVGDLGRGLAISRAFAQVRSARGRLLMDTPVHVRTLAEDHVSYRAMMHLAFYTAALLGFSERPRDASKSLLRLCTPLAKMLTAKAAIHGLQECMENLGGVGYLENEDPALNVAQIFRNANVLSIWEGTTNIQADDVLRIIKGTSGAEVLRTLQDAVSHAAKRWEGAGRGHWAESLREVWQKLETGVQTRSRAELALDGRALCHDLGWVICTLLLAEDALRDGDEISGEICARQPASDGIQLVEIHHLLYTHERPASWDELDGSTTALGYNNGP
ncbi:hypothetical protein CERZMDRAFT_111041 [Cercospora zeae-maydis SCOH1-5]|uniref:Acyl-CoA dehydrogenase/oxidase C-terminal domain-containing protein n=1 Tax=Cercospora zeae-maydis SCOH1-5 TaxID=717836 RepID=A0A6A6FKX4_9PEZI|nr:hypothetical protein CERZMDRAFT_111041 [Cercospora zeae-maydis SCOH1-5]